MGKCIGKCRKHRKTSTRNGPSVQSDTISSTKSPTNGTTSSPAQSTSKVDNVKVQELKKDVISNASVSSWEDPVIPFHGSSIPTSNISIESYPRPTHLDTSTTKASEVPGLSLPLVDRLQDTTTTGASEISGASVGRLDTASTKADEVLDVLVPSTGRLDTSRASEDHGVSFDHHDDRLDKTNDVSGSTSTKQPDASVSATKQPDASVSTTNQPDASVSATNQPDASVSATNQPDASVSATNQPDASVSATNQPSASVSAIKIASQQKTYRDAVDNNVQEKYTFQARIGDGAYGIVWEVMNEETQTLVALKKIHGAFSNPTTAKLAYREIMLLRSFHRHPNIIQLLDVLRARNNCDIYLVFELMDMDLTRAIASLDLRREHHRYIMYQLFSATSYMHSVNVAHRDYKPQNILLNRSDCMVKVCDLGLARSLSRVPADYGPTMDLPLTRDVISRWYRPPEILLSARRYTTSVDMWSLGCILAEIVNRRVLFRGNSNTNQLKLVMAALPTPTNADVASIRSLPLFITSRPSKKKRTGLKRSITKHFSPDAKDLCEALLKFNPQKRLPAAKALEHPYVSMYRGKQLTMLDGDLLRLPQYEGCGLRAKDYRREIYKQYMK